MAPDRIYRVQATKDAIYFLCVSNQFDAERETPITIEQGAVFVLLSIVGALRKHRQEEQAAGDLSRDPEELLDLHPDNFKLVPAEVQEAVFLPPKWYSILRRHHGCLFLRASDGRQWYLQFEELDEMRRAFHGLGSVLGSRLATKVTWDDSKNRFVKAPKQTAPSQ
jgi:hypothetical protein